MLFSCRYGANKDNLAYALSPQMAKQQSGGKVAKREKIVSDFRRVGRFGGVGAGLGLAVALAIAIPAFGAGTGYTPGAGPTQGGTATGLPGTVVSSTVIQPTGGSGSGTVGTTTVAVTVPAGAFTGPTQLVITDATSSAVTPSNGKVVTTFGVGFYVNGTKVTGSFPAVTVTVTSPSITAGSTVYFVTGTGLQAISGAQVSNGSATITITSDPTIEVVSSTTSTSVIAGATTAQTGKPVVLELGVAGVLIVGGGLLLVGRRLRRRSI